MSGEGDYNIQSRLDYYPLVGIYPLDPIKGGPGPVLLSEEVHINGTGAWHLTPQGDNTYQFNVVGRFSYTGVSDKNQPEGSIVISTNTAEDNRLWYVTQDKSGDYTIALADDRELFWTVQGVNKNDLKIVLQRITPGKVGLPNPFYHLFRLVKLD